VLPYKDRLELFSRYLQQLVMESLGKERDLDGNIVHQGLTVYGNKGSTDQHAYVQQLRDGVPNFFVTFIEVAKQRDQESIQVEPDTTSGDFLFGFLMGTRQALFENGRESITLTIQELGNSSIGALVALFERSVGYYASLVNVNAYHQPGVEAGKKAAEKILQLQMDLIPLVRNTPTSVTQIAAKLSADPDVIFKLCEQLAVNGRLMKHKTDNPFDARYSSR
jgi:glucose-6-phosphate isomerase